MSDGQVSENGSHGISSTSEATHISCPRFEFNEFETRFRRNPFGSDFVPPEGGPRAEHSEFFEACGARDEDQFFPADGTSYAYGTSPESKFYPADRANVGNEFYGVRRESEFHPASSARRESEFFPKSESREYHEPRSRRPGVHNAEQALFIRMDIQLLLSLVPRDAFCVGSYMSRNSVTELGAGCSRKG